MAEQAISPAKAVLLAVDLVTRGDFGTLRTLITQHRRTLRTDVLLRIILTYLPESTDSSDYVPFLQELASGSIVEDPNYPVNRSKVDECSEEDAAKKVNKLKLLLLKWKNAPEDVPEDPLVLFLMHRAIYIDDNTGLIIELPELLEPFLHYSTYLRTWYISTILPLLRLNYDYHPNNGIVLTIPKFERLNEKAGAALLLSKTGKDEMEAINQTVGRDLRGLIGPWMYGDTRWKRRKLRKASSFGGQFIPPLDDLPALNPKYAGWEEVFKWVTEQAATSWITAVAAVAQWDGPGDVDLGGFQDGTMWLDEDDQQHLEKRYARSAIAAAYLVSDESPEALAGVHQILSRIVTLLDQDRIPSLQQAAALLFPVSDLEKSNILSPENAGFLRKDLLEEGNILTSPKEESVKLLHALVISAFLCVKAGRGRTVRRAGELALLQDARDQKNEFEKLMICVSNGPKGDDKYWVKMRNELLWLRSWGAEELSEGQDMTYGRGIFGRVPKEVLEAEFLKSLLANTRYTLANSIYESSSDPPLSPKALHDTVIYAAMNAYDNATNANRTRGGVKKCQDILNAFPDTLTNSLEADELDHLIAVTHDIGQFRLVFKQGEPFKPVMLRVHSDPISIIDRILDQNPKSYTQINELIAMGKLMVKSGLTVRNITGTTQLRQQQVKEQELIAEKRVVSMCIDNALTEDDFETAYSYVETRLKDIAGPAQARSPPPDRNGSGLFAELPPKTIDDWSWKAALQAGKYRRTIRTVKPTHLGNATGNLEIRHLQQRMDCLSHALRLAPKSTLQEILNVFRRCEEELEAQLRQEDEQEAAWDAQGDDQAMPGGFASNPQKRGPPSNTTSRSAEEAPMSLFDLSRASMARAQNGLSALSVLRGSKSPPRKTGPAVGESPGSSRVATPDSISHGETVRKRDQLRKAAVGTFAAGVGWVLGAPAVARDDNDDEKEGH